MEEEEELEEGPTSGSATRKMSFEAGDVATLELAELVLAREEGPGPAPAAVIFILLVVADVDMCVVIVVVVVV